MHTNILKLKKKPLFNKSCVNNTKILIHNNKQILNFINYYNYIKQALKLKHVYIENIKFFLLGKNLLITLNIYFSSLKLSLLKKRSKYDFKTEEKYPILRSKNSLFPKKFSNTNKLNNATIKFYNINKKINIKKSLDLYINIKTSIFTLLKKKRYLLMDFIKITTLLIEAKVSIQLFSLFIGQMFLTLSKKNHNRFFLILKKIFKIIISDTKINKKILKINGFKLQMSGRIRGKTRADKRIITVGTVPLQSHFKHIEYFTQHIFTVYGVFGLKLWVFRNISKE